MTILLLMIIGFTYSGQCGENAWRGLQPLKSSRQDVEKLIGKPKPHSVSEYAAQYSTEDGGVSFTFSRGGCDKEPNSGWNVPELTVIQIIFYPNAKIRFADLQLRTERFTPILDHDVIDFVEYINVEDGVSITVDEENGTVSSYRFFPTRADRGLLCE